MDVLSGSSFPPSESQTDPYNPWFEFTISWYENTDGHGSFAPQKIITTQRTSDSLSLYPADLDGDADIDVLYSSEDTKLVWYENTDGNGMFDRERVISDEGVSALHVADLDGDGDNDVLSALWDDENSANDQVAWYENRDGRGSFGPRQIITTQVTGPRSVFAADVDGDGDVDVISASFLDDKIAWYQNTDGRGSFGPQNIITRQFYRPYSVDAVDLDNDGDTDVLAGSFSDTGIAWLENTDGRGAFGPPLSIAITSAYGVHAADLDGDGDNDAVSCGGVKIAWYENLSIDFAPGDANRDEEFNQLDLVQVLQSAKYLTGQPATWAEGDWNGDGVFDQLDIVASLQTANYLKGSYGARSGDVVSPAEPQERNVASLDVLLAGVGEF